MAVDQISSSPCPVYFCGTPVLSAAFDTFCANAQKIESIGAQQILVLDQVAEKVKDFDHGVLVVLLANKNNLVGVMNILVSCKKRIDKGVMRVLVYCLLDHAKVPALLKQKGCTETLSEGLTQKALVHKLQRHIQIVTTKHKSVKQEKSDEATSFKKEKPSTAASRAAAQTGKLKFIPPIEHENDCWLVKNKKDFKFVRGMWMGEMIGPGPSVGSWNEAGGSGSQSVHRWVPRAGASDIFLPVNGSWFSVGKKPEFVWKSNRWLFIGETPSLFFKPADGGANVYRFRCPVVGQLEVGVNSTASKGKLQTILNSFADEKTFKDEKKKQGPSNDLTLSPEERKVSEMNDSLTPDEEAKEWGELDPGEVEEAADWNDEIEPELDPLDWGGMEAGRGNKFNNGRGVGQGQGGNSGYSYEEDEAFEKEAEAAGWKKGAEAFESIQLEVTAFRADQPGKPQLAGVSILERQGTDLLLDAPESEYIAGEKFEFSVILSHSGKKENLELTGTLKNREGRDGEGREMILVAIAEVSHSYLTEIQKVFDVRQEQLLRFLKEAKGNE